MGERRGTYYREKIVWITGASSGIGEAVALAMIEEGATVIASSTSSERLNASKAKSKTPQRFHVLPLDMADPEQIVSAVSRVISEFGRVDILINNAGISQRSLALDTPISNDRRIMEIDYFGPVVLTKAVLPYMIAQGGGRLVCTSSIVGVFGFPLRSAYSAAKHAMHGFFESVRAEYYDSNIKVNIIIGGRIQTAISTRALTADGTPYGKMDDGQKNGISSEEAARQILKGIRKNKREIPVGGKELLMVKIKRWLPGLHFRISRGVKPV